MGGTEVIQIDARVVAATNRDLVDASKVGRSAPTRYDPLNVVPLAIPLCADVARMCPSW